MVRDARPLPLFVRVLATLLLAASLSHAGEGVLRWKGKVHDPGALPEGFPETAVTAVRFWAPWCERRGYSMELEAEGRVLLVSPGKKPSRTTMRLVDRVLRLFESEFPPPRRAGGKALDVSADTPQEGGETVSETPGELPEDPEGGTHPWKVRGAAGVEVEVTRTSWGAEDIVPDRDPAVFLLASDARDYASLVDHLAEHFSYLAPWKDEAVRMQGFVNAWPLTATLMQRPDGVEEWSPNNELVNRLARLLFLRRYGRQPYWAELGVGWHFEVELLGGVYVFPYRDEFVWAVEHDAWPSDLARTFGDRGKEPLRAEEFCDYRRGRYRPTASRISFGFIDFLAREKRPELPELFEALRSCYDEKSRVSTGRFSWKRDPDYQIPVEEQNALLRAHLGADVFERASEAFRRGVGQESRKRRRH